MRDGDRGGRQLAQAMQVAWQQPVPDVQELLAELWRRRLLIVAVALLVLAAVVPFILLQEPVWRAEAMVAVSASQPQVTTTDPNAGRLEEGALETEIAVIRARERVELVIAQLGLDKLPAFNPLLQPRSPLTDFISWLRVSVESLLPAGDPTEDLVMLTPFAAAIEHFLDNLETTPVDHSQVISVALTSTNRARVADAVNALVAAYLAEQTAARRELMAQVSNDLEAHAAGLAQKVRFGEQALEEFRAKSGLIKGREVSVRTQGMVDLTTRLAEATAARATAEAKLAQSRRGYAGERVVLDALNTPHVSRMLEEVAILTAQEGEFAERYGDRHPLMTEVRGKLGALRSRIDIEMDKVEESLRLNARAARATEQELTKMLARQEEEIGSFSQEEATLRDLERTATADRTLLESLQARSRELGAEALFSQPNARVVAEARPPLEPAGLSKAMLLGLAVPAAFAMGGATAFVLALFDRRPRGLSEIEFGTSLPVVAAIPRLTRQNRKLLDWRGQRETDLVESAGARASAFLIKDSMRDLYAGLLADGDREPGTVLFTSSLPGEGKTSTAVTFARLLARHGKRVLVIDGDLRRPVVHHKLGLADRPGLSECLAGTVSISEALQVDRSGLSFLPAGCAFMDVGALAPRGRLCQLLDAARVHHDVVVIDSAPVLTAAETRLLSTIADRTVFLVRSGYTPVETVRRALRLLAESGAKVSGITLSMVPRGDLADYGYTGRYGRPPNPGARA